MTEEVGSDRHRNPSSAEMDIVKLKERYTQLKEDAADTRHVMADIKELLIGYIQTSDHRHAQLLATFNQHNLEDAVIHTKVLQIDKHLENTDANVAALTASNRSPIAIALGILSGLGTAATAIWIAIKGGGSPS